jgi:flavin reductase (DIM6/NTAB) family NADH-FMN oxidoreductase RutF
VLRPIAWVSTVNASGARNLAPHSYFNAISDFPPCVMFSIEGESDTYRNLQTVPEFVVNFVTPELAQAMELTACHMPPEEDEFHWSRLTPAPSHRVRPPRVADAKASLECRVLEIREFGRIPNHVVFGEVVRYSVDATIWKNGRIDPNTYQPIGRLSGRYALQQPPFKLSRPDWEQVEAAGPESALSLVRKST